MTPIEFARLWILVKPVKRIRQWRTKRKMRSWAEYHADEVAEDFNSTNEEVPMLRGKLTYTSVAALVLVWLGERFGVPVLPDEAESLAVAVAAVVAAASGIYGRWRATRSK